MIPAFRTAIWSLGSGSILIAAAAFSGDVLRHEPVVAEIDATATESKLGSPAEIAGDHFVADLAPTTAPSNQIAGPSGVDAEMAPSPTRTPVFRNASLDRRVDQSASLSAGKTPAIAINPEERVVGSHEQHPESEFNNKAEPLITKIYRPMTIGVTDLERLIRPLLTPGIGTAVSNRGSLSVDDNAVGTIDALLIRDRQEVLSQIDAVYADLEDAPKRVVVDALLADIALPDSVPSGWELRESELGVIDGEPRTVLNSLGSLGAVTVIAGNQLQIVARQWGQLEWTDREIPLASSHDSTQHLSTRIRIRPSILANGLIRLEVHPTSSRLNDAASPHPQIATVTFTTDVALRSGATALIAGSGEERIANPKPVRSAGKMEPQIQPQSSLRHETVLLLMPRISHDRLAAAR
jgi:Bacterial type II and III secretion system protein